jgi:hypothetical protein
MRRWFFSFFQVDSDKMTRNFVNGRHKNKNCQERVDILAIVSEKAMRRNKKYAMQIFYCVSLKAIALESGYRAVAEDTAHMIERKCNQPPEKIFY